MPLFPEDRNYSNVNEIAKRYGLMWAGGYGSPYDIEAMIEKEERPLPEHERLHNDDLDHFKYLFDHTVRFKQLGRGRTRPVMAITSPYARDTEQLRKDAFDYADRFMLAVRVNDPEFRVYSAEGTVPIVFWRPDIINL